MKTLLLLATLLVAQASHAFYDASIGRWISRDPIAEEGGINLSGFVGNEPIGSFDHLGLIRIGFYGADLWWTFPNGGNQEMDRIAANSGGATMFRSLSHEEAFQHLLARLDTNGDGRYGPGDTEDPIKVFGWSWGGISAVKLARKIQDSDKFCWKEVSVVAVIDPVSTLRLPSYDVPSNVKFLWNRYQLNGRGVPLPFHGRRLSLEDKSKTLDDQIQADPHGRDDDIDHVTIVTKAAAGAANVIR